MIGHRLVAIATCYIVLASPFLAHAQCKADVDCKGDRICDQGRCVDPTTKQEDAPPPPPPPPTTGDDGVKVTISDHGTADDEHSTGWAFAAGIIGFIGAAAVLGLTVGSEITKEDQIPSLPLGAAALVIVGALGPVTFVGGGSARRASGATGLLGLRIGGWIAYGVSLAIGLSLVALGVSDVEPPAGLIAATGVIGAASLTLFAIDAMICHGEASEGAITSAPSLLPSLVIARESSGAAVPGLGVAARF